MTINPQSEVKCKGSCGELIPREIALNGGKYTESTRSIIHHPNGICHHISKNICPRCLLINKVSQPVLHPKESPVGQSVEWNSNTFPNREDITRNLGDVSQTGGWEEIGIGEPALNHLADIIIDDKSERSQRIRKIKHAIRGILSSTLTTLVKEMELLRKLPPNPNFGTSGAYNEANGFNAGISASIEIVKKMV